MLVKISCKKCGESGKLDIGDKPLSIVLEELKKEESFHCGLGNHVELSSRLNYWTFGELTDEKPPTIEEQLKDLKNSYTEIFSNDEFHKQTKYSVSGFSMGCCICTDVKTGEKVYFDFKTLIDGKRYYYKI